MNASKFSHQVNALFWSSDGKFSLSDPLKMYHGYLIHKFNQNQSSKINQLVWRIVHFATGLFLYPVLGLLAGLDMGDKLLRWHFSKKNQNAISSINLAFLNVHSEAAESYSVFLHANLDGSWEFTKEVTLQEYDVAFGPEKTAGEFAEVKQNLAERMKKTIDELAKSYIKVNIRYFGSWENGMNLKLLTVNSSLPYCSNPLLPQYEKIKVIPSDIEQL